LCCTELNILINYLLQNCDVLYNYAANMVISYRHFETTLLELLTLEDGTARLSRNDGKK